MIELARKAAQFARITKETTQQKEEEVAEELIEYPYRLIEPGVDPAPAQIAAIKLGILTDRGLAHQIVGREGIRIRVVDMERILKARGERSKSTTISANIQAFISESASVPANDRAGLNDWFIKAVELHQTFDTPESSLEVIGPERNIQAIGPGIDEAWTSLGLPELAIERVQGKFGLTYSRLNFAPAEAPDIQPLPKI